MSFQRAILTHGGAGADPNHSDGTHSAAEAGLKLMQKGRTALDAVVQSVRNLEEDERFNAGTGSQIRADGQMIQLDASCMTSNGEFGAVGCIENMKNPIDLAEAVLSHSKHILLVGDGAHIFARELNIPLIPVQPSHKTTNNDSTDAASCDTVGAVAFDGKTFAAALSSGGLNRAALGRVGDVPLPGCGLFSGKAGAVACTGDGEDIAVKVLAKQVYDWLEQNISAEDAAKKALDLYEDAVDVGLIIVTPDGFASNAKRTMPWSHLTE